MQINAKVKVSSTKAIEQALADPRQALNVTGRILQQFEKKWLVYKGQTEPNKLGGARTNFWADVSRTVQIPRYNGRFNANIDVTHPLFSQKYLGGKIVPKRVNFLTIPTSPLSYGKPASSFDLVFHYFPNFGPSLVLKSSMQKTVRFTSQRRGKYEIEKIKQSIKYPAGSRLYALVKEVNQKPTPGCFPPQNLMEDEAQTGLDEYLKSIFERDSKN